MRFVVLGLLLTRPATIYLLNKQFEASISLFYRASLGALRNTLQKLDSAGEVCFEEIVDNGRHKKVYTVTDKGKAAFFSWLTAPVTESDAEVAGLSRLFFLGLITDNAQRLTILHNIFDRSQQELAKLEELASSLDKTTVIPELAEIVYYQRMTVEWGIKSAQAICVHLSELIAQAESD